MKQFLVLYRAPIEVLDEWMQKPEAERKEAEEKMQAEWGVWMQQHGSALKSTAGAGKNIRVTSQGSSEFRNDIMLFSIVEAESQEAVAKMFESHPHFGIPQASIDIMPANDISDMQ